MRSNTELAERLSIRTSKSNIDKDKEEHVSKKSKWSKNLRVVASRPGRRASTRPEPGPGALTARAALILNVNTNLTILTKSFNTVTLSGSPGEEGDHWTKYKSCPSILPLNFLILTKPAELCLTAPTNPLPSTHHTTVDLIFPQLTTMHHHRPK